MLHGQIDHDGGLQARAHYNWAAAAAKAATPAPTSHSLSDPAADPNAPHPALLDSRNTSTTKLTAHVTPSGGQSMLQVEHDHHGSDYTLNVKAVNPNPIDTPASWSDSKRSSQTGIYQVAYLQSVSRSLAVGGEFVYQRPNPEIEEPSLTLALRYAPPPATLPNPTTIPTGMQSPFPPVNPRDPTQVFTTTFAPSSGLLHSTYWRRLNQRLEVSAELQALLSKGSRMGEGRREGIATVGFKLDTISATIRGQVDSQGRLSAVVEERIAPGIALQLAGEIDYGKGGGGAGRVGAGFTLEM
ncbi:translocase of outer mitochondrial membrane [Rhizophlyctis rosea]|nr:translocase of outer mitochondrial membrane [Rhizophlyctis rosea]